MASVLIFLAGVVVGIVAVGWALAGVTNTYVESMRRMQTELDCAQANEANLRNRLAQAELTTDYTK